MNDPDAEDREDPPHADGLKANTSRESQRRELELQLQMIRSEASAARLEAKAAEVELMIRRLSGADTANVDSLAKPGAGSSRTLSDSTTIPDSRSAGGSESVRGDPTHEPDAIPESTASTPSPMLFRGWDEIRDAMSIPPHDLTRANDAASKDQAANAPAKTDAIGKADSVHRFDTARGLRGPHLEPPSRTDSAVEVTDRETEQSGQADEPSSFDFAGASRTPEPLHGDAVAIEADGDVNPDDSGERSRPGAWLVSTLIHVAILILLAAVGLSQHRPKDQVALTASASVEPVSMETFEIESSEPETDPQPDEPNPSEVEYELSPVGDISASDLISDAPVAPASTSVAAMLRSSNAADSSMVMKPNSDATMEFCGVKGGGNHFVYLVDSSGSMGDAFDSARTELLRSIDLLEPEQRFYVVFFDAESDYMRLSDPDVDESRSVKATRANRDALKRWAMRIQKDRGRAPYEPLRFALGLKPDVIFLLSDGEFPQSIEDLLKEENRVVNLFGDNDPISIIHTISYHSKDGESRMKRIAEQNQGMYRHVPRP